MTKLEKFLTTGHPEVVSRHLKHISKPDLLIHALRSEHRWVQNVAYEQLKKQADALSNEQVVKLLQSGSEAGSILGINQALARKEHANFFVGPVAKSLPFLPGDYGHIQEAAGFLAKHPQRLAPYVHELIVGGLQRNPRPYTRIFVDLLRRHTDQIKDDDVRLLAKFMEDTPEQGRMSYAYEILTAIGARSIPHLRRLLVKNSYYGSANALHALVEIGKPEYAILGLGSKEPGVKYVARETLEKNPVLAEKFKKHVFKAFLHTKNIEDFRLNLYLLIHLQLSDKKFIQALRAKLKNKKYAEYRNDIDYAVRYLQRKKK